LPVDDSRISSEMLVDSGQQLFVIDKLENIKTLNNGPVPLGLKLTIYVIKSQIHFVRQSLFLWRGVYFYSKAADLVLPTHFNIFQPERPKKFNKWVKSLAPVYNIKHHSNHFIKRREMFWNYSNTEICEKSRFFKGTVSWDRFQKCWRKWTDLGLIKGRSWFLNFSEAPLIFNWNKTSVSL
jgi:hypothetical protein